MEHKASSSRRNRRFPEFPGDKLVRTYISHFATLVGAEAVCSPSAGDLPARPDPFHVPTGTARRFLRARGEGDRAEKPGACGGQ